jgi:hypothetical protein
MKGDHGYGKQGGTASCFRRHLDDLRRWRALEYGKVRSYTRPNYLRSVTLAI